MWLGKDPAVRVLTLEKLMEQLEQTWINPRNLCGETKKVVSEFADEAHVIELGTELLSFLSFV